MHKRGWPMSRIMADIAILAVGMTAMLALRTSEDMQDTGVVNSFCGTCRQAS